MLPSSRPESSKYFPFVVEAKESTCSSGYVSAKNWATLILHISSKTYRKYNNIYADLYIVGEEEAVLGVRNW